MRSPDRALESAVDQALEAGDGVLPLLPTWIPRSFLLAGRRLKLQAPFYNRDRCADSGQNRRC